MNMIRSRAHSFRRPSGLIAATVLALGLAACDKAPNAPTVGQQIDSGIRKTEEAGAEARIRAEQAMRTTESKLDAGANNAGIAMKDAANSATDLARDAGITAKVSAELARDPDLSAIKIDVDTQAGVVRLTGPAPTQIAKDRASMLAQAIEGVLLVNNELIVTLAK